MSAVERARTQVEATPPIEDPWLLSYADLVTNLLAFMVVLVSLAAISFDAIDALPGAFSSKARAVPNLRTLSADVENLARTEGLTGQVVAELDAEGLAIQIQDQIVFASGVAELSPAGRPLVDAIARLILKLPPKYRVVVEGHTDDVPINTPRFPSNWELSASRALEVRRGLEKAGVPDERIAIMAFADTRPVPLEAGLPIEVVRQKNRRVVIRVH